MKRLLLPFLLLFLAAFVIGGVLLALEQELWGVVVFTVLILVAVVDMVATTFRIGRGDRRLARRADTHRGRATVLEAREIPFTLHLGGSTYQPRMFELRLRVEVPEVDPYEVNHHVAARPWDVDHIRPGNVIECRVHPRRRRKLVLVFPEGTTPFGVDVPGVTIDHGGVGGGASATAVVQGLQDLGATPTGARLVELDLLVSVAGEVPYRVVMEVELAPGAIPGLGRTVPVEVDPRRPSRVRLLPG